MNRADPFRAYTLRMGAHHGKQRARVFLALFIAVSLLCGFRCSLPWPPADADNLSIVSYNAHNLFDSADDGGEYPEFTAAGGWDDRKYRMRLENLAKAVLSFFPSGKEYPDILCLQEIESIGVLADLVQGVLKSGGYRWIGLGGPEDSAIKSGFLSRFPVVERRSHALDDSWGLGAGREIVEVVFDTAARGSSQPSLLTVMICHWKSRREGAAETEPIRRQASRLMAGRLAEIARQDASRPIVCLGDFNESPDELKRNSRRYPVALMPSPDTDEFTDIIAGVPAEWFSGPIRVTGIGRSARVERGAVTLYSPWFSAGGYSYRYEGEGERLDGFLLSPAFFDGSGLEYRSFKVADDPALIDAAGNPAGWNGSSGYSDHLPILLDIDSAPASALTKGSGNVR